MSSLFKLLGLTGDKDTPIVDTGLYKVFIVPIHHRQYKKLAVLRIGKDQLLHCVYDGIDWLLVDCYGLTPSPSGVLSNNDIDHITYVMNLEEFLNDKTVSHATWRTIGKEKQVILEKLRR
jgi:hypothetical protein